MRPLDRVAEQQYIDDVYDDHHGYDQGEGANTASDG